MFNNPALDVFIGLLAIFLLYSLLASILMEIIAKRLGLRQRNTLKAISKLLDDSPYSALEIRRLSKMKLTALFYAHPNVRNLGDNWINTKPSSITPEMFADTLIQLLRGDNFSGSENQIEMIKKNLLLTDENNKGKLPIPKWYESSKFNPLKIQSKIKVEHSNFLIKNLFNKIKEKKAEISKETEAAPAKETVAEQSRQEPKKVIDIDELTFYQIEQFILDAGADIDLFRKKLIGWYNEMMDRAEGWYIRTTRGWLFVIGLFIAISFNVDAIYIGQQLSHDKTMRDNMVTFASHLQKSDLNKPQDPKGLTDKALANTFKEINDSYDESKKILGQGPENSKTWGVGWLITALAISLGAPFWFDLLGKVMCIRQGGSSSATDKQKKTDGEILGNTPIG